MSTSYDAKDVIQTYRKNGVGNKIVGPKSPAGTAIPVGWVLTEDGRYIRELNYDSSHTLSFFNRLVSR